jgi:hypothetical protein
MPDDRVDFGADWVSVPQVTALVGVSRQAVHQWLARGRLAAIPTDDGPRIARAELDRFLAARRAAADVGIKVETLRKWTDRAALP